MTETINIIINGKHYQGKKGEYLLDVARRNGIEIPTLCHDPRLEPYSSCFVCVVEVEGMRGLQPSCSTRIAEGMKVETENEKVRKSRKGALDLIMSNHYADCQAPCTQTCPANVDVQGYISLIEKGLYSEAIGLIKETNPLPAICGRVCVRPCEAACRRNLLDEGAPVGIDYMKRFAADWDLESGNHFKPEIQPSTGKKIAIIGAGPGGLSAAYWLQQKGHQCDIYEAAPFPGGWLRYGIPSYRLPNELLDKEIETITELGVNIYCNKKLGDNLSYKEIKENYDATILTIGSQKGTLLGVKGEGAQNVFAGIDFLKNMEITGKPADFTGKKVVVVGGGNTAMDCCRTSIRCGSTDVKVVYRRTEKEMPANPIEIHESKLEGVEYLFLNNPINVNSDANGILKSVTLIKMELGEPDASGRQRPVPVEGSEYELECDYILAAIGQKTDVNFIDDINNYASDGQLVINRWGDLDADRKTLQTGIKSVFAAGDGVTGPATIIEAIAQAKTASNSAHQFVMGLEIKPEKKPFVSKKDNFKTQITEEYKGNYTCQSREEMPVLPADQRFNFKEVELGYSDESVVKHEAERCLECGCGEFYDCDLQKYSEKYEVDQKKFAGDFNEYKVDFSHPYIEIDSNKCILCSRCIRICKDVVGANALGLVNRGFKTYVAPSLGDSLTDTNCESCGMCIDTCPTGAISENFIFKPGPVKLDKHPSIDIYGSEGVAVNYMAHKSKYVMKVEGDNGLINPEGSIGRRAKFGYKYLNSSARITKPLLKTESGFEQISFEEAYKIIQSNISATKPQNVAVFGGARLSNEELFMVQRFGREAVGTNYIGNFHYLGRGVNYLVNSFKNTKFDEIGQAGKIWVVGAELTDDNDFVGFLVNNARVTKGADVEMITNNSATNLRPKVDSVNIVFDYFRFFKAVNYYLINSNKQNSLYIKDQSKGFDTYIKHLGKENYEALIESSGSNKSFVEKFANEYNDTQNAILIFSEKYISSNASQEIYNLAVLTGKLGKTASGLIPLKQKNNSQGLFDMGIFCKLGVGHKELNPDVVKMKQRFEGEGIESILIFGEDPVGCAIKPEKVKGWLSKSKFIVVQDSFMTETCAMANLILPASFHVEAGGSFTNTQQVIQQFDKVFDAKIEKSNIQQINDLSVLFGLKSLDSVDDVFSELITKLPVKSDESYKFVFNEADNSALLFNYGCDYLNKMFDQDFEDSF